MGLIQVIIRETSDLLSIVKMLFKKGGFKNEELQKELEDYLFRKYHEALG